MSLSDHAEPDFDVGIEYYADRNVKQFIKELKALNTNGDNDSWIIIKESDIDKLAGDKLI